jgi:pimeloyl-ACP methyl ester carboxylesterase
VFESFDGIGIAFDHWPGERGPVVLHHGFAASAHTNWVAPGIVDRLTGAGFDVAALDARGHGRSDKPHDPARYGEATMAKDVSGLVDHLGYDSFLLVGYSMGAIVSLLVAASEPRLRRLVVGGIGGRVARGGIDRTPVADALRAEDPSTITNPDGRAFRAFAERSGNDLLALAAQAEVAFRDPQHLDRITAPTLVIAGEDDPLARRPELLVDGIADARLVRVPGDHLSAVGRPELADVILAFLEEDDA